jgi:hypothetical protein
VKKPAASPDAIDALRVPLKRALQAAVAWPKLASRTQATPGVPVTERLRQGLDALVSASDGFLRREAIAASLTDDERREILWGMVLTRALDNRLKVFFTGSEVRYAGTPFQGKGFRSLGQEAIYASALRLRRGAKFRGRTASGRAT